MRQNKFEELQVWNKAHTFVLKIYQITKRFPEDEKFGVVSQMRRSSVSICANLAEGYTKGKREFARYIDIAKASLEETKYFLILSKDLQYINISLFEELNCFASEIGAMLYGLKRSIV